MVTLIIFILSLFVYMLIGGFVTFLFSEVLNIIEIDTEDDNLSYVISMGFPILIIYVTIKLLVIEIKKYKNRYKNLSQKQLRAAKLKKLNKRFKFL